MKKNYQVPLSPATKAIAAMEEQNITADWEGVVEAQEIADPPKVSCVQKNIYTRDFFLIFFPPALHGILLKYLPSFSKSLHFLASVRCGEKKSGINLVFQNLHKRPSF